LWDKWQYILVSFCPFVDRAIVLYWLELSILLFDKEEVCSIGTPGFSYGASFQVFFRVVPGPASGCGLSQARPI